MLHKIKQYVHFTLILLESIKERNQAKAKHVNTKRNIMRNPEITLLQRIYFKAMNPMQSAKNYTKYIQIRTKHL